MVNGGDPVIFKWVLLPGVTNTVVEMVSNQTEKQRYILGAQNESILK